MKFCVVCHSGNRRKEEWFMKPDNKSLQFETIPSEQTHTLAIIWILIARSSGWPFFIVCFPIALLFIQPWIALFYYIFRYHIKCIILLFKGLITVGKELRQQHPSDLLSGAETSPPEYKSRGCCCPNSQPTVVNPDYNMTKQRCIKRIYHKIRSKSRQNRATSPNSLHCGDTHLLNDGSCSFTHLVLLDRKERRRARKILWPVDAGRVISRYQNNLYRITNHHNHIWDYFRRYKT